MKSAALFAIVLTLFNASVFAQSAASTVKYYNMSNCSSWIWANTTSGSGFMCSSAPMTVAVPEVYSTVAAINDLETVLMQKISDLEARIEKLEKPAP